MSLNDGAAVIRPNVWPGTLTAADWIYSGCQSNLSPVAEAAAASENRNGLIDADQAGGTNLKHRSRLFLAECWPTFWRDFPQKCLHHLPIGIIRLIIS